MALPSSRNTDYAAGSQVKSADLNDLQDEIIDLNLGKCSSRTNILRPSKWDSAIAAFTNAALTTDDGTLTGVPCVNFIAANTVVARWSLPLRLGDRLLGFGVTWYHATGATKNITAQIFKTTGLNGPSISRASAGSALTGTKSSTILRQTHTLASPIILASYEDLEIFVTNVGTGGAAEVHRVYAVDFTWDRLGA